MAGAGGAHAADVAAADTAPAGAETEKADFGARVQELVVTTTSPVMNAAPQKTSLNAVEPQTIITREAIDQFVPATADYTQIVNLSPSVSGGVGQNGPGLSEPRPPCAASRTATTTSPTMASPGATPTARPTIRPRSSPPRPSAAWWSTAARARPTTSARPPSAARSTCSRLK
ncbi:MAG: hypothetical protein WDN45_07765 [Caulobacteraceae bacterium]